MMARCYWVIIARLSIQEVYRFIVWYPSNQTRSFVMQDACLLHQWQQVIQVMAKYGNGWLKRPRTSSNGRACYYMHKLLVLQPIKGPNGIYFWTCQPRSPRESQKYKLFSVTWNCDSPSTTIIFQLFFSLVHSFPLLPWWIYHHSWPFLHWPLHVLSLQHPPYVLENNVTLLRSTRKYDD